MAPPPRTPGPAPAESQGPESIHLLPQLPYADGPVELHGVEQQVAAREAENGDRRIAQFSRPGTAEAQAIPFCGGAVAAREAVAALDKQVIEIARAREIRWTQELNRKVFGPSRLIAQMLELALAAAGFVTELAIALEIVALTPVRQHSGPHAPVVCW
jgi:hypothetical protein